MEKIINTNCILNCRYFNCRNDTTICKMSTLVLGEMLKGLADKYLNVGDEDSSDNSYARDIHVRSAVFF